MTSRLFTKKKPKVFSQNSTPAVPNSLWFASDFLLGAGMVLIQEESQKVAVVYDTNAKNWFLPKGRKDVGESLEDAALREAYEESGYRVTFLPLYKPTCQPAAPGTDYRSANTEPIYITTVTWGPRKSKRTGTVDNGGEYLSFYYIGKIAADAVREEGTGMPDEQGFTTHLLDIQDARAKLKGSMEEVIVAKAWEVWQTSLEIQLDMERKQAHALQDIPGQ